MYKRITSPTQIVNNVNELMGQLNLQRSAFTSDITGWYWIESFQDNQYWILTWYIAHKHVMDAANVRELDALYDAIQEYKWRDWIVRNSEHTLYVKLKLEPDAPKTKPRTFYVNVESDYVQ
jgi:hypothetical protein